MKPANSVPEKSSDMDATKLYLKQVSKNPLLKHEQEIQLSQQIKNSKKALFGHLFEIPLAVKNFETAIVDTLSGKSNINKLFDIDEKSDELMQTLVRLQKDITAYRDSGFKDAVLKASIAVAISELPVNVNFFDHLVHPFAEIGKQIVAVQGEYMRFAMSKNVSREVFLDCYQSSKNDPSWVVFILQNSDKVKEFQERLTQFSVDSGISVVELQNKIIDIKKQQKLKDQAIDTMLKSNLRLVVSVAKKYTNVSQTPLLDLIQEGNIGLLKAIDKFDWRLNFRFSTYATWWIKQCVLKALNEQHRIIRIPTHMSDLAKKVIRAREESVTTHGFEPSIEEIAAMLKVDADQVEKVYTVAQGTVSLETPIGDGEDDQTIANLIEDVDGVNAFQMLAEVDKVNAVSSVLCELTPKEERVIRMRFGIGTNEESTLEDIGNKFGVTRERIRQIETKALIKLKNTDLSEKLLNAFD
jgi:RNA polymerase primary sigma factor